LRYERARKTIKGAANEIANIVEPWLRSGACDGFMMHFRTLPGGLKDLVERAGTAAPQSASRGLPGQRNAA
jgi:hypothetical protein